MKSKITYSASNKNISVLKAIIEESGGEYRYHAKAMAEEKSSIAALLIGEPNWREMNRCHFEHQAISHGNEAHVGKCGDSGRGEVVVKARALWQRRGMQKSRGK